MRGSALAVGRSAEDRATLTDPRGASQPRTPSGGHINRHSLATESEFNSNPRTGPPKASTANASSPAEALPDLPEKPVHKDAQRAARWLLANIAFAPCIYKDGA